MARGVLVAEGTYHYLEGENDLGRETWQLSRLGHGGHVFDVRTDFLRPHAQSWVVTYELSAKWAPRGVTLRSEHDHQIMRAEHRAQGKQWRARVNSPAGAQDFALDFSPKHEVVFVSPIFASVVLVRLALNTGQSREVDGIAIQSGSLAPLAEKQMWFCVAEEKAQVPAGSFDAYKFEIKNPAGNSVAQLWSDSRGIVLRVLTADQREIRLTNYLWHART